MLGRRTALAFVLVLVAPALAGCADDSPAASSGQPRTASDPGGAIAEREFEPPPATKRPSERWHFHDHWKGSPTITLAEQDVVLEATIGEDGVPVVSALVHLEPGVIVPPETGRIEITASWADPEGGLVNLTFRPADATGFYAAGDLSNGGTVGIGVTESMADVPHRQQSLWAFNLTAKPETSVPPSTPPRELHVVIQATIGRPLFVDPPHVDWWALGDVLPLVEGARGAMDGARTPAGNLTIPSLGGAQRPTPGSVSEPVRVPVTGGWIVPEGAKTVLVSLNWTTEVPDAKLLVHHREANDGTTGPLGIVHEGASSRVFSMPVDPDQTDTTYSNRTTWEFLVMPDGETSAFQGEFTLYAWVSRLDAPTTLRETIGAR